MTYFSRGRRNGYPSSRQRRRLAPRPSRPARPFRRARAPSLASSFPSSAHPPPASRKAVGIMDAPIKWNASASRLITTLDLPRWRQLRQGLHLALVGQPLALLLGLAG